MPTPKSTSAVAPRADVDSAGARAGAHVLFWQTRLALHMNTLAGVVWSKTSQHGCPTPPHVSHKPLTHVEPA
jgi:hypothetical protein